MCSTTDQEVIIHWCSTNITMEESHPVNNDRKTRPHGSPAIHIWMGTMKVRASFNKLDSSQTGIVLLRSNQSSDCIANSVKAHCHVKEIASFITSKIRRNIKLLIQLLQTDKIS